MRLFLPRSVGHAKVGQNETVSLRMARVTTVPMRKLRWQSRPTPRVRARQIQADWAVAGGMTAALAPRRRRGRKANNLLLGKGLAEVDAERAQLAVKVRALHPHPLRQLSDLAAA